MSLLRAVYAKLESNCEPERARVCQRVAVRASESQSGSHREPERAIFSIPKHCFVAKQLNKTLFCHNASKYGIFCRKLLKYAEKITPPKKKKKIIGWRWVGDGASKAFFLNFQNKCVLPGHPEMLYFIRGKVIYDHFLML